MTEGSAAPPGTQARAPQPLDRAIGASLRLGRRGAGLSQQALADGLGVSWQQVRKYEAGRNRISASTLVAAARLLHVPAASLLPSDLPADANSETSIAKALDTPGALDLLRAFALIADSRRRAAVLCIAEGLAGPGPRDDDGAGNGT